MNKPAVCTPSTITTTGSNGDETKYPRLIGTYTKGLPHDALGEVDLGAWKTLQTALTSGKPSDFAAIQLGGARKLTNPQAGLAGDLEIPKPSTFLMKSAPTVDSAEAAAEMVELYWMALLRDLPFQHFQQGLAGVTAAVDDINKLKGFTGPEVDGKVTPATLFRGCSEGDNVGPFLSQFLLRDVPYGSLTISQKQQTARPHVEYMTGFAEWLAIQNGAAGTPVVHDPERRYIRSMRDLAEYVHVDALYEAYLNACLILLGLKTPVDAGNPYAGSDPFEAASPSGQWKTQIGFGTFGGPHVLSLVCEVATRALKTIWYQKWYVHRRLRPEAYGGLVHLTQTGVKKYPVHEQVLKSKALEWVLSRRGTGLLPMAFPEGSPTHPSYGAGHATVAGACVTVLKAWFDEDFVLPEAVQAKDDGTDLEPCVDCAPLTVGGELNKLAANIAIGRNMAGVHWRSDYLESVRLGERVAVGMLLQQSQDYNEPWSLGFRSFYRDTNGRARKVLLTPGQAVFEDDGTAYPIVKEP